MRWLAWCARVLMFFVMLGLAVSNTESVRLRFLGIPELEGQAPFVVWLLIFFTVGALLGVIAMLPRLIRQRRELARWRAMSALREAGSASADGAAPQRDPGLRGL